MTLAYALAALAALCLLLGIAQRWIASRERGELGLPPGEVLFADSGEERGSPLVARSIALRGGRTCSCGTATWSSRWR